MRKGDDAPRARVGRCGFSKQYGNPIPMSLSNEAHLETSLDPLTMMEGGACN